MRPFLIFILSLLLTGCALEEPTYPYPQKSQLVREINNKVFSQLRKERNLHLCECGGGGSGKIKFLHCGFFYYDEISVEEARELLFAAGSRFLNAFNADERIHPHLDVYPLKPENVEVEIFLKKSNGSELGFDTLHVLAMTRGNLEYITLSAETERLKTVFTETYEEAAAKLNACAQLKEAI